MAVTLLPRTVWPALVAIALLLGSCSLDGFLFNSQVLEAYDLSTDVIAVEYREAVLLTSGSETLHGYYCRQPDSLRVEPHPVIVYHHGNYDHLQYYWPRVEYLYQCGFDVFIYDYRGYGMSTGKSTDEESLKADALAALNYVRERTDVDTTQIVHYGFSLGGVPALWAATRHKSAGVITESIFASGEALVQTGTVLNIPGGYLLRDGYRNIDRIAEVDTKLLMFHGKDDIFVPLAVHGEALYRAAKNPKTIIRVEGAGHEGVPAGLGISNYRDLISAFVRGS